MGEELDQQRIVVGGVVTGIRRVITKARPTMGVATLEDLQGPTRGRHLPQGVRGDRADLGRGRILLVAGRVDHKGEETVLLADGVWTWEDATALGPQAFGRAVSQVGGRRGGRGGYSNGNGAWSDARPTPTGSGMGRGAGRLAFGRSRRRIRARAGGRRGTGRQDLSGVSPLRGSVPRGERQFELGRREALVPVAGAPRAPLAELVQPASLDALGANGTDEPPWPDEATARLARDAQADTQAVEATAGRTLHVRFQPAPQERVVESFRALRELLHERPGETQVVLHIPAGGGREQRMELRTGVAYDAELLAEVQRRLGDGLVTLHLS